MESSLYPVWPTVVALNKQIFKYACVLKFFDTPLLPVAPTFSSEQYTTQQIKISGISISSLLSDCLTLFAISELEESESRRGQLFFFLNHRYSF